MITSTLLWDYAATQNLILWLIDSTFFVIPTHIYISEVSIRKLNSILWWTFLGDHFFFYSRKYCLNVSFPELWVKGYLFSTAAVLNELFNIQGLLKISNTPGFGICILIIVSACGSWNPLFLEVLKPGSIPNNHTNHQQTPHLYIFLVSSESFQWTFQWCNS